MQYPLTLVLLSLCHLDRSINKTDKPKLINPIIYRNMEQRNFPDGFDAVIIDGFFYLHTLRDTLSTFDAISRKIL